MGSVLISKNNMDDDDRSTMCRMLTPRGRELFKRGLRAKVKAGERPDIYSKSERDYIIHGK